MARAGTKSEKKVQSSFLGLPGSMCWPGWAAMGRNMWDTSSDAAMFPPKVWGYGWSFNFAYPTIKSKPLWKRALAFVIGVVVICLIAWLLICLAMLIYFLLTPSAGVF